MHFFERKLSNQEIPSFILSSNLANFPTFLKFPKKPKVETEEAGAQTVGRISPPVAVRESSRAAIAPPCTETCQICDFVVLVFLYTPPSNSPTDSHFPPTSDFPGEPSGTTKTTWWC